MFKEKIILFIKSSKAVYALEYGLAFALIGIVSLVSMTDAGTAVKAYMMCIAGNSVTSTSCF